MFHKIKIFTVMASLVITGLFLTCPCAYSKVTNKKTSTLSTLNSGNSGNTFRTPDFAFPRTVLDNATLELSKSKSDIDIVKAIIQISIANSEISNANFAQSVAIIDSIATIKDGATASILYCIEGKLYAEKYQSAMWKYNQRKLSSDSIPSNPDEWDTHAFSVKIEELVKKCTYNYEYLTSIPLEKWQSILSGYGDDNADFFPTLYHFLAYQGIKQLSNFYDAYSMADIIPFFIESSGNYINNSCYKTDYNLYTNLYNYAISRNAPAPLAMALTCAGQYNILSDESLNRLSIKEYNNYINSPYSSELLAIAFETEKKGTDFNKKLKHWYLNAFNSSIKEHHNYRRIGIIENCRKSLTQPSVSLKCKNQYLPCKDITVTVNSLNAPDDLFLSIYKIKNPSNESRNLSISKLLSANSKVAFIESMPVGNTTEFFTDSTYTLAIPALKPGEYIATLSKDKTGNISSLYSKQTGCTFRISDLGLYQLNNAAPQTSNEVCVINATNGTPIANAAITVTANDKTKQKYKLVSDSMGMAAIPVKLNNKSLYLTVSDKQCTDYLRIYNSKNNYKIKPRTNAEIFTDLAIYHPGDTVKFSVIAYTQSTEKVAIAPNEKLTLILRNASGVNIDTVKLESDKFGRTSSEFHLPQTGLLGNYQIYALSEANDNSYIGGCSISVEQYKAPRFYVKLNENGKTYEVGDTISIAGVVSTYSGIPVTDAKTVVDINYSPYWWKRMGGVSSGNYSSVISTDKDGRFSLVLPTKNLKNTGFEEGRFAVTVTSTSSAGETESTNGCFYLGKSTRIDLSNNADIQEIENATIKLYATTSNNNQESTPIPLKYSLENTETHTIVAAGKFISPCLEIEADELPSGKYKFVVSDTTSTVSESKEITFYRANDKWPPYQTALWTPQKLITVSNGQKSVKVTVGSSFVDSYILCKIEDETGISDTNWLKIDATNQEIEIPTPDYDKEVAIFFATMRDCVPYSEKVVIRSHSFVEKLRVEKISFRDSITAGGKERWTFRYRLGDNNMSHMPVIATMSDKALNALIPFRWSLNTDRFRPTFYGININSPGASNAYFNIDSKFKGNTTPTLYNIFPSFNTYGRSLLSIPIYIRGTLRATSANVYMAANVEEDGVKMSMKEEAAAVTADYTSGMSDSTEEVADESAVSTNTNLRMTECPSAFFMPNLSTNEDGTLDLSFTVPDLNTTWQLQLLGYTPLMNNNVSIFDVTASKPLMVQSNLPRFLRTADIASLVATIFNNSPETQTINTDVELFDPLTNRVISRKIGTISLQPAQSGTVSIDIEVPDNYEFIGYKVIAKNGEYSDGEQSLICIRPSSTPVLETYPFYLDSQQKDLTIRLPESHDGETAVFQYCENPVWYCITALPEVVTSESANILTKLSNLYGFAISEGLVNKYPEIQKAIKYWTDNSSSVLISNLQKDNKLKMADLDNTPWINNAKDETLRMSRLKNLLDSTSYSEKISTLLNQIRESQQSDGGWAWCEGMNTSPYITSRILLYFAMLNDMTYMPQSPSNTRMISNAATYIDKDIYGRYIRNKHQFSVIEMLNWMYIKSCFHNLDTDKQFKSLEDKAIKSITTEWKNFDIYNKATAAILLNRRGYNMLSRTILESLRQFAMTSPDKGMWFDNLNSGWQGTSSLITTTQVLEAYYEIEPTNSAVDDIRQWLLMQRQAQDWGRMGEMAEVIHAVLTTGSDWTSEAGNTEILINGEKATIKPLDKFTGEISIPIDLSTHKQDGSIKIMRRGSQPAWGGLSLQYIAPIDSIKQFSAGSISIDKQLYKIDNQNGASTLLPISRTDLKVGDKVRVQLTVVSDRDIEYVTINDERSGCLNVDDQLSQFKYQDGIGFYREICNTATNFYINFLPKGTFIITYDCHVNQAGQFSVGIASMQSLYAPMLSAHSAGTIIHTGNQQ